MPFINPLFFALVRKKFLVHQKNLFSQFGRKSFLSSQQCKGTIFSAHMQAIFKNSLKC